jgi:hypothetical protein
MKNACDNTLTENGVYLIELMCDKGYNIEEKTLSLLLNVTIDQEYQCLENLIRDHYILTENRIKECLNL